MKKRSMAGGAVKELIEKSTGALRTAGKSSINRIAPAATAFVFALISGGVECAPGIYPFGISILCAANGTYTVGSAFAGAMLSTLGMRDEYLFYIIAVLTTLFARVTANIAEGVFSAAGKGKNSLFREDAIIRIGISAGIAVLLGLSGILRGGNFYFSIFSAIEGALIFAIFTAAFIMLVEKSSGKSAKTAGVCAAAFAAVLCLESLNLPFGLGVAAGIFLTVLFAYSGGTGWGFAVGASCGIAVGGVGGLALALLGGTAGMLFDYGDIMAVTVSFFSAAVLTLVNGGLKAGMEYMPEAIFVLALTVPLLKLGLLPKNLVMRIEGEGLFIWDVRENENSAVRERCRKIGDSMEALSKMLISVSSKMKCPTPDESYRICTAARAKYCGGCRYEAVCSGEDEKCVTSFFANMSHSLSLRGKVTARIVPESLAKRCYNMDSILDGVNTSAERLAGMSGAVCKTELLASDYMAISELLREAASSDSDYESDKDTAQILRRALSKNGFEFRDASVFGKRRKSVYMYGVNCAASDAGEADVRECAERVLGTKMSRMEFSIEQKTVCASMHSVPAFSVKSGRFTSIGERDISSGDTVTSFENESGYYYSLVSDGMGSGREAALTSGLSAAFLKELLSAGCPMKSALELLNCFVRGNETECFTTVDLMEADLITGRARFIKSGAAPSFVLRDGQLFRLHSKTVPVGIMRALDAEAISFDLRDNDTVIMISDGVTGNYEDCPWLYELLCDGLNREDSPSKMAKTIGEAAVKNTGREDDITVAVMKITAV